MKTLHNNIKLETLIDVPIIRKMSELFYTISGAPIGILDIEGNILVAIGWQDICTKFHRINPQTCAKCHKSDKYISNHLNTDKFVHYKCANGLNDLAYPLIINNIHLATIFLGQFFYENQEPDRAFFINQAKKYKFNETDYLNALDKVPRFSKEKVDNILEWNISFAKSLKLQAEAKLKQKIDEEKLLKTQQELTETSEILRSIIDHSPSRLFWKDKDLTYQGCNKLFANDAGLNSQEDIVGKTDFDFSWKNHEASKYVSDDIEVIKNGIPKLNYEESQTTSKGNKIWVRTSKIPLKDFNQKIVGILGVYDDITKEKEASNTIKENLLKFKSLSKSGSDLLAINTLDQIYGYITETLTKHYPDALLLISKADKEQKKALLLNISGIENKLFKRAVKIMGNSPLNKWYDFRDDYFDIYKTGLLKQISGNLVEFSDGEISPLAAKAIEKLFKINKIYTLGITRENNVLATLHILTLNNTSINDPEYIESFVKQAGIAIERKLIEQSYKESEEKFKAIANYTANWESWFGTDGKLIWVSPEIERMAGYTPDEVIAMPDFLERIISPMDYEFVFNTFKQALTRKRPQGKNLEFSCIRKNGSSFLISVDWQSIYNSNGEYIGIRTSGKDITDRKLAEIKIEEQNKELQKVNATKDKLFSIIAHDLRNPLNTILGFSELLKEESKRLSKQQMSEYNGYIHQSSNSMFNLLENLLLWSRAQQNSLTLKPEKLSLRELINESLHLLEATASSKQITIDNSILKSEYIYADKLMINTVIRNVISNAIKFTPISGKIKIESNRIGYNCIVRISDSGVGINKDKLKSMFDADVSHNTKGTQGEEGTGLGLLICKEFIELNNGKIWIESIVKKGTKVSFQIPVY